MTHLGRVVIQNVLIANREYYPVYEESNNCDVEFDLRPKNKSIGDVKLYIGSNIKVKSNLVNLKMTCCISYHYGPERHSKCIDHQ